MKKTITLLVLLLTSMIAHAQYTLIPDPNFEQAINDIGADDIIDGQVLTANISLVTEFNPVGYNIQSLAGIEDFASLESLDCRFNQITTLDLSGLLHLEYVDISANQLTSVNLSGMVSLGRLNCSQNQITSLDLTGLTNLIYLEAGTNQLTSLDVSGLTNLQYFNCQDNYLTSINVSSLVNMTFFNCGVNLLTSLNVNGLTNLQQLRCSSNQITSLNVVGLTNLQLLYCAYNQLTVLDMSNLTNLRDLICEENHLVALDLNGTVNLNHLDCSDNQLLSIDLTGLTGLTNFNCVNNQLSSLDASLAINLEYLFCHNNQLTSLNVTGLTDLYLLHCSFNQLPSIDVSSLTNLANLQCSLNQLTSLDLSGLTKLRFVRCNGNLITSINLTGLSSLDELSCIDNLLTSLDLSTLHVIGLNCTYNNALSCIQVSNVLTAYTNPHWTKDAIARYALDCSVATVTPVFAAVAPICSGQTLSALPTTSVNAITGFWSPAINNTATTIYIFTPTAGQDATTANLTITVNQQITPSFTAITPICAKETLTALPTTSLNGITGTWSPALNNLATTTYTFTPTAGQCATSSTLTINVIPNVNSSFAAVAPICSGDALAALPTTSLNGITGTWSPALNNTATTTYTFSPAPGQCAKNAVKTIVVNPVVLPVFTQATPVCIGKNIPALPVNSLNGITGTWSPALNNMATTTYTFTPNAGQCAATTTMTIVVIPATLGGTVSGGTTVCKNATSGLLTLSGHNGSVLRWESSTDNFATITVIANTSSNYTSGALTRTTKFRAIVQGCSSEESTNTTVTVSAFCGSLRPAVSDTNVLVNETKLYPNPTSGDFSLDITAVKEGTVVLEMYSINGTKVKTANTISLQEGANNINENISNLASGVYFVRLTNTNSGEVIVKRVTKK